MEAGRHAGHIATPARESRVSGPLGPRCRSQKESRGPYGLPCRLYGCWRLLFSGSQAASGSAAAWRYRAATPGGGPGNYFEGGGQKSMHRSKSSRIRAYSARSRSAVVRRACSGIR
jgi:hypothetical protein